MPGVEIVSRTQRIIVLPNTSVSLVKQGPTGPTGATGPTGSQGPIGPPGADGSNFTVSDTPPDDPTIGQVWIDTSE